MASNYWDSTQAKFWTFTKAELADLRKDLERANPPASLKHTVPDRRLMNIYFQQQLLKLARRLQLRQQALATAQIYIKRFYLRVEMRRTNPYLIMATAVYLACKMEECPQHIRLMLGEAARQWPELGVTEASKIGECEFSLISTLSSRLICHHPHRSLMDFSPLFGLNNEEIQLAQNIINDSYNTDLLMLYPPHVIAVTSIFMALVLKYTGQPTGLQLHSSLQSTSQQTSPSAPAGSGAAPSAAPAMSGTSAQQLFTGFGNLNQARPKLSKLVDWVAESKIDMNSIVDATQEMISLYEVWEGYSERVCKEAITKFVKDGGAGLIK